MLAVELGLILVGILCFSLFGTVLGVSVCLNRLLDVYGFGMVAPRARQ